MLDEKDILDYCIDRNCISIEEIGINSNGFLTIKLYDVTTTSDLVEK